MNPIRNFNQEPIMVRNWEIRIGILGTEWFEKWFRLKMIFIYHIDSETEFEFESQSETEWESETKLNHKSNLKVCRKKSQSDIKFES